jgi:hypothetical protein
MAKFPSPFLNTLYYFSFLTPLKGVLSDVFTFINLPVCVSRFVHNPVTGLKTCDLPLTAPTLALSPIGLFVAMIITSYFTLTVCVFVLVTPPLLTEVFTLTLLLEIGFAVTFTLTVFRIFKTTPFSVGNFILK